MAQLLAEMGVKPNQQDTLQQIPLYYAVREGHIELIDFLIKNGCSVNHLDTYGQTPIFYCIREGDI